MKKLLAVLLMFVVCTAANASILNLGFETSEGYPAAYGDSGSLHLYDHGWDCTSVWYVPYIANSTFADTGQRSSQIIAIKQEQHWASYQAEWTPSAGETTVIYSSAMAFQKYPYGDVGTECYGGIALRGKKANSAKVTFGGMKICADGTVTIWNTDSTATSSCSFSLNNWYHLQMRANYANNTIQFFLDGNPIGSLSFNSDIIELDAIALYTGSTNAWSVADVRYDTISLNVPEPATVCLLSLGALILLRRKK
jgi:hypothetical protein